MHLCLNQLVGRHAKVLIDIQAFISLNGTQGLIRRQCVLEEREDRDNDQCTDKNEHGILGRLRNLFVQRCSTRTIDILILFRVFQSLLELRVFIQVKSTTITGKGSSHQTTQTGRNGNHQNIRNGDIETICVRYAHKCHDSSSNRRTSDTHLRCDRSHTTRTLRTDSFLESDVADDRHEGIHHMSRSHKHRQEESTERSQECDSLRFLA